MLLRVFYLDDEIELCENFSDYFQSENVKVSTFTDPLIAIEAINANPPDLFFVDYRLPGTTGDLVAQSIDPVIPKFLITGESSLITKYPFLKVFEKPYRTLDIFEVISLYRNL